MAKQICKYCCGCGFKVGIPIYPCEEPSLVSPTTGIWPLGNYPVTNQTIKCKACNGTGWLDEDREVFVPIKFVKEEFFKNG